MILNPIHCATLFAFMTLILSIGFSIKMFHYKTTAPMILARTAANYLRKCATPTKVPV